MTVEKNKVPKNDTGVELKRIVGKGVFAIFSTLLAFSLFSITAEANVWGTQVQSIDNEVGSFKIANLNGPSGQQLKLNIKIPKARMVPGASLTFYGLPDKIILSSGIRKSKVWIVPVDSSNNLTLIAPSGFIGRFEAAAILRRKNGQVIEGQRFVINIKNTKLAKKAPPQKDKTLIHKNSDEKSASQKAYSALSVRPADKVKPKEVSKQKKKVIVKPAPEQSNINPELAKTLLTKGKQLLKDGNIIAARETLKFLAEQGNAESAHLIAKTYDPEEFKNFNATGIEPDLEEAKKWYTIAAKLGAQGAQHRLQEYADAGL